MHAHASQNETIKLASCCLENSSGKAPDYEYMIISPCLSYTLMEEDTYFKV